MNHSAIKDLIPYPSTTERFWKIFYELLGIPKNDQMIQNSIHGSPSMSPLLSWCSGPPPSLGNDEAFLATLQVVGKEDLPGKVICRDLGVQNCAIHCHKAKHNKSPIITKQWQMGGKIVMHIAAYINSYHQHQVWLQHLQFILLHMVNTFMDYEKQNSFPKILKVAQLHDAKQKETWDTKPKRITQTILCP